MAFSEVLSAAPENAETMEFGSGVNRAIEIRHPETNHSIRIEPQEGEGTYDVDRIRLDVYDGSGELVNYNSQPNVGLTVVNGDNTTNEQINVTVEGDEDMFSSLDSTFNEFELALVENGEVVDTSNQRLIGIGYSASFEQDGTEDQITVTVPRDEGVNEDWDVTFRLGGFEQGVETDVENIDGAENFTTTVDVSELEAGNYTGRFEIYKTQDAPLGDRIINIFGVNEFQVGSQTNIPDDHGVDVNTSASTIAPSAVTAGDTNNYTGTAELENLENVTEGDVTVSLVDYANSSDNTPITETVSAADLSGDTATVTVSGGNFDNVEAPAAGTYEARVTVDNFDADVDGVTKPIGTIVSQGSLGIKHAESSVGTTSSPQNDTVAFSEVLNAAPENAETMEFGSGVDRAIEIRHPETDNSIRIKPQADEGTYDVERIRLGVYDGSGELDKPVSESNYNSQPNVDLSVVSGDNTTNERINVTVEGDEDIFSSLDNTFNEFELALVENGEVVDTSNQRLIGIGYRASFEQNGTEDEITVTVPRDEGVNEDWDVRFTLGRFDDNVEAIETDVENTDSSEEFEATLNVSEFESGQYTGSFEIYKTQDAPFGDRIISISSSDELRVNDQSGIQPEVTLQSVGPAGQNTPTPFYVTVDRQEPEVVTLEVLDNEENVVFEETAGDGFEDGEFTRWDTTNQTGSTVADGSYDVVVTVEDQYGNEATAKDSILVDNTAPTIEDLELVEPVNNVTNGQITVRGNVSDTGTDVQSAQVAVIAESTSYSVIEDFGEVDPDGDTLEASFNATNISDDVGDGSFRIGMAAFDSAGNLALTEGDSFTVDTTSPTVQSGVDNLTDENATLTIEVDENVTVTSLNIEAADSESSVDRTPEAYDAEIASDEPTEIEFDGGTIDGNNTTFTIDIEATDEAGNTDTYTLTSSIASYEINEAGTTEIEPKETNSSFALATNVTDTDTTRTASISESASAPAGTELATDQIAGEFIDVEDIGLADEELENATVAVPLDSIDISGFDDEDLTMLYSPDGESDYEPIETEIVEDENQQKYLVTTVSGFSQLAPAGIDDEPPTIQEPSVTPGTQIDLAEESNEATVNFDYTRSISDIDTSATSVEVSGVDTEGVSTQITKTDAEISVSGLEDGDSIDVDLTVVDDAGNEASESVTLSVEDSSLNTGDGSDDTNDASSDGVTDDTSDSTTDDTDDTDNGDDTGGIDDTDDTANVEQVGDTDDTDETDDTDDADDTDNANNTDDTDETGDTESTDSTDSTGDTEDTDESNTPETPTEEADDTNDSTPGFGALVALVALIATALIATRQEN